MVPKLHKKDKATQKGAARATKGSFCQRTSNECPTKRQKGAKREPRGNQNDPQIAPWSDLGPWPPNCRNKSPKNGRQLTPNQRQALKNLKIIDFPTPKQTTLQKTNATKIKLKYKIPPLYRPKDLPFATLLPHPQVILSQLKRPRRSVPLVLRHSASRHPPTLWARGSGCPTFNWFSLEIRPPTLYPPPPKAANISVEYLCNICRTNCQIFRWKPGWSRPERIGAFQDAWGSQDPFFVDSKQHRKSMFFEPSIKNTI